MHNVLRFWLDRGVDGFRVDVLWHLAKDPKFRDDPINPDYREGDPPFMICICSGCPAAARNSHPRKASASSM